jgi:hypothetical protein
MWWATVVELLAGWKIWFGNRRVELRDRYQSTLNRRQGNTPPD